MKNRSVCPAQNFAIGLPVFNGMHDEFQTHVVPTATHGCRTSFIYLAYY